MKAPKVEGCVTAQEYADMEGISVSTVYRKGRMYERGDHKNGLCVVTINGFKYVRLTKPIPLECCATECFAYGSPNNNGCKALSKMDCEIDAEGNPHCAFYKPKRKKGVMPTLPRRVSTFKPGGGATDCFAYGKFEDKGCRALIKMDCEICDDGIPRCAFYKRKEKETNNE